jgi:pimeloyl-ACP methyl ester carboxylesterase
LIPGLARQVFVAGHDWGANVAWQLCLLRPDLVRALVNLSVVYHPRRSEGTTLQAIKAFCGEDHYMCRFQVKPLHPSWFRLWQTKSVV